MSGGTRNQKSKVVRSREKKEFGSDRQSALTAGVNPGHSVALRVRIHQTSANKYLAALMLALVTNPLHASVPAAAPFSADSADSMEVESSGRSTSWLGRLTHFGVTSRMSKNLCPIPLIPTLYYLSPKFEPSTKLDLSVYTNDWFGVASARNEFRNFYCSFEHPYEGLLISCTSRSCWAWLPRR
jgi:hypothetical protein